MSKIKAAIGITKNLGNYESLRLDASEERDVSEGENKDEAWKELWKSVENQLEGQLEEAKEVVK
jgi:predicted kinase